MTSTTAPSPAATMDEIRKRHEDLSIMYGGEPWDESCVEDGEQAHMDRAALLSLLQQTTREVTAPVLAQAMHEAQEAYQQMYPYRWDEITKEYQERWVERAERIIARIPRPVVAQTEPAQTLGDYKDPARAKAAQDSLVRSVAEKFS